MITISLLGVDKYLAPELVKKIHQKIANLYESSPEEVIFYAPDSFLIYNEFIRSFSNDWVSIF